MDVGRLVFRAATRFAGRVALDGPQGRQTFAELGVRVARLANGMRGLGLGRGDRVLDLQANQNSSIEADLACAAAGLVRVALNYRLRPDDWARIADDCGAVSLIYDARFAEPAGDLRHGIGERHCVVIGDGPGAGYERLIARSPARLPALDVEPDGLVSLNYTSGTTGRPKGVRRTHRNRFASLVNMTVDVLGGPPDASDVYLHAGPITHTSGLFVLPFLTAGAAQMILPSFDAESVIDAVERRAVTHTALVPTMIARLLALPVDGGCAGLKMLGYAGAPMPPEQIRQAAERITPNLVQYYGLVEAIPPVTVLDAAAHAQAQSGRTDFFASAGRPCLGVEIQVVDDDGTACPTGDVGEVVTRGDHVTTGYWGSTSDEELNRPVRDGWLYTGDLGRLDENGWLWLVDRKGDMIITGGYNVYPREVEDVIAEVPGVHEVAVVGVTDAEWGQRVVALYTVHSGAYVPPEAVDGHCRDRLASYKKPKDVRQVQTFPVNSTGKIAKNVLRERLEAHRGTPW